MEPSLNNRHKPGSRRNVYGVAEYFSASKFLYGYIYCIPWKFCIHALLWYCKITFNISCKVEEERGEIL